MYVVLNDSQRPELTIWRNISFPVFSSRLFTPDLPLTACKRTCKLYKTERILIKQTPYKAEIEAFAGKAPCFKKKL